MQDMLPSMNKTRFVMIGGFLGAGKTTAIARLAKHYTDQGLRIGIVTNDQAYGLVDTESLRAKGFDVGEVPGACFCCKFNDLLETVSNLSARTQPDIILTEPVGSCTDLVATVLMPLNHLFGEQYELSPLVVLCKPEHGKKILQGKSGGFSPQAEYIFLKQLEEAEAIVLNKIDRLTVDEQAELIGLLQERFPEKSVIAASGVDGTGFDKIISILSHDATPSATSMEVDYDTYADGEATLGWLNASVRFTHESESWDLDSLVTTLVKRVSQALVGETIEPGHVKVLASTVEATAVANWVASDAPVELSVASSAQVLFADVLVNVRAHAAPEVLSEHVREVVNQLAVEEGLSLQITEWQHLRPGRPEPTHRFATPTG